MTVRNVFLSLILSLALTFVVVGVYVLYPILSLLVGGLFQTAFSSQSHTDGVAAVAGGINDSVLLISAFWALASFLIIFTLLQRRHR